MKSDHQLFCNLLGVGRFLRIFETFEKGIYENYIFRSKNHYMNLFYYMNKVNKCICEKVYRDEKKYILKEIKIRIYQLPDINTEIK